MDLRQAFTQSLTTVLALGGLDNSWTFIRKNVMEVRRSTVDLRSMSFSLLEAGKLFRYIERSIRRELCSWSRSFTNFSFWNWIRFLVVTSRQIADLLCSMHTLGISGIQVSLTALCIFNQQDVSVHTFKRFLFCDFLLRLKEC